jgi:hypothetical protein
MTQKNVSPVGCNLVSASPNNDAQNKNVSLAVCLVAALGLRKWRDR